MANRHAGLLLTSVPVEVMVVGGRGTSLSCVTSPRRTRPALQGARGSLGVVVHIVACQGSLDSPGTCRPRSPGAVRWGTASDLRQQDLDHTLAHAGDLVEPLNHWGKRTQQFLALRVEPADGLTQVAGSAPTARRAANAVSRSEPPTTLAGVRGGFCKRPLANSATCSVSVSPPANASSLACPLALNTSVATLNSLMFPLSSNF